MGCLNYLKYYLNNISYKLERKYIIKYDAFSYSDYFNKQRKYAKNIVHTCDETNEYIKKKITSEEPLMIARFGSTELYNVEVFDLKITKKYENAMRMLCHYSGFFPYNLEMGNRFKAVILDAAKEVDVQAIWNVFMEEFYVRKYMRDAYLTQLRFIEPWFSNVPWTEGLKGKRVLVIHPFIDSIQEQYKKRKLLFEDKRILPEFSLITIKAVQTLGNQKDDRFETWFDALNYMYDEACKLEFDVALLGCGAYGFPLAAMLKRKGKKAIHMGGVLQILFGIKGARWDTDPVVSKLYNDAWIRPNELETIKQSRTIENGCYW